jgi:hypothetical protein
MSEMQVHLSEARVSSALDKLARMETLVSDRLLPDGGSSTSTAEPTSLLAPGTSTTARVRAKKQAHRALDVSGPVKPYNPSLKNFWYPVAFSSDLKEDTMVNSIDKSFKPTYSLSKQSRTSMCLSEEVTFTISGADRLFRRAVGDIPRERWKTWMCSEHMCSQSLPSSSWFSE